MQLLPIGAGAGTGRIIVFVFNNSKFFGFWISGNQ